MTRTVKPELLDALPPNHPAAIRSRRDLRRVNWWMDNHRIMVRALGGAFPQGAPRRMADFGAGDGRFMLRIAKTFSPRWSGVHLTLLDLQPNIAEETLAAFAPLGWQAKAEVGNVLDWLGTAGRIEVVTANLFIHHFEDARLRELFRLIAERANLFIAVEPHRFALPYICGQLMWMLGCNHVTRHDAAVSVGAGFIHRELTALWPDQLKWRLFEGRAGLFSHLFIAQKIA